MNLFFFPTFPTRATQNDVACAANEAVLKPFFSIQIIP